MTSPPDRQKKRQTLRRHGTLNPQPESVTHPLFQNSDFFDPDDLLQVKYEMLRQVHVDQQSISEAAHVFGFSRPSFYQSQAAFQEDGVFGVLPHKRGPQGGHKLTSEVMDFVIQQRSEDPALTPEQLAQVIQQRFRVQIHPRSIQRRLLAEKKTAVKPSASDSRSDALRFSYEDLRTQVLAGGRGPGLAIFQHHGMCEWIELCRSCTPVMAAMEPVSVSANPECVPAEARSEIVAILAGLFLQKRLEATR